MSGPRASTRARMDAVLAALREADHTMRCLDIAAAVYIATYSRYRYAEVHAALNHLVKAGLVERVPSAEMRHLVQLSDGRVVDLGPEAGAVGWRAVAVDADGLAELEAMWAL